MEEKKEGGGEMWRRIRRGGEMWRRKRRGG